MSRNVYLVGSVPMASARDVFAEVSAVLGTRIKRLPDGETGERGDEAFYRPFRDLKLPDGTALFLGVVHAKDGVAGAKTRIAAARRYAPEFGIATECGMARARSEQIVRELLKIHAACCDS